jgi:UDP-N-acetyl-D-mannosaminuronate dehydrogenase
LPKEKVLIVGLGEVGQALFELLKENEHFAVYVFDTKKEKMREIGQKAMPDEIDTMHVCIPCVDQKKFAKIVVDYIKRCRCLVAHSPIRGVHESPEHMKWELKRWTKYIGGADSKAAEAARKHFEKIGLKTKVLKSCQETELAKLFETTYRAWLIAFFQEMHRISKHFKADFDEVVDFLEDTHRVRLDRPLLFPGVIGKHCIIPNLELLMKDYDSEFLQLILKSNEKRKEEIKDESVRAEIEKIKERAETLEKELNKANSTH